MQVDWLQAFVIVAEHENVSAAARHLFVDQSTVSRHLARLQKATGLRLFRRTPTGVELTVVGLEFLPLARACVSAVDAAQACAAALRRTA